jgi:hypothetical protein
MTLRSRSRGRNTERTSGVLRAGWHFHEAYYAAFQLLLESRVQLLGPAQIVGVLSHDLAGSPLRLGLDRAEALQAERHRIAVWEHPYDREVAQRRIYAGNAN